MYIHTFESRPKSLSQIKIRPRFLRSTTQLISSALYSTAEPTRGGRFSFRESSLSPKLSPQGNHFLFPTPAFSFPVSSTSNSVYHNPILLYMPRKLETCSIYYIMKHATPSTTQYCTNATYMYISFPYRLQLSSFHTFHINTFICDYAIYRIFRLT